MVAAEEIIVAEAAPIASVPHAEFIEKDELTRFRIQQLAQEAGSLAVSAQVAAPEEVKNAGEDSRYPTLMHALRAARSGDPEAREMVENNAKTQVWEVLMKQIVMEMPLLVDERGRLLQSGQLLRDVYKYALLYASVLPEIRERTLAEMGNGFIMERLVRQGMLADGKKILVVSRFPDNMSEEAAGRVGFFRETMSCAIQLLHMKDGVLVQESGFVAGRSSIDAPRHDQQAIEHMLGSLGVSAEGLSATGLLDRPLLLEGNIGMADLLKLYDDGAGGTFFGLRRPRGDYREAMKAGRKKLERLESTVQQVVAAVIAKSGGITHPLEAIKMLHTEAQRIMVDLAMQDDSIEARVFHEGAEHIVAARQHLAHGDMEAFQKERQLAHATARTASCAMSTEQDDEKNEQNSEEKAAKKENKATSGTGKISAGYCRTSNCPTEGKKTLVGECHVCLGCQDLWDHNIDPSTVYLPRKKAKTHVDILMAGIQTLLDKRMHDQQRTTAQKGAGKLAVAA